jgi:protein arginine kinase activator
MVVCQMCGKNPATKHYTEIHDQKMSEVHLCESCAAERGLETAPKKESFDLADLLTHMADSMTSNDEERVGNISCPRCGLRYSAFKETGRLGCAECYTAFQYQLRPLLRRIHGDTRHRGKAPTRDGEGARRTRQIHRLHDELQRAVEREEFEHAASIRDEIRRLEAELATGGAPGEMAS